MKQETIDFKDIATRLAEYHGCVISRRYVNNSIGKKSLVFEFPDGHFVSFDTELWLAAGTAVRRMLADLPERTLAFKHLVMKYLLGHVFRHVFRNADEGHSAVEAPAGWVDFHDRRIRAYSPEELSVKLAVLGF